MKTIEKFKSSKGNYIELLETENKTYFIVKTYTDGEFYISQEYGKQDAMYLFMKYIKSTMNID